jgi:peptidoglycan/LPS O-acetylase OafA/YrhL
MIQAVPPFLIDDRARRLDAVHCLRGFAAFAVCLMHVSTATTYGFPASVKFLGSLGECGVPVFFVISGFVVPLSLLDRQYTLKSFPRFVLRRIVRLDPPYFASLILALVVVGASHLLHGTPFPYDASDVLFHVGYLSGLVERPWILSTFWTLGIEFQYYILIGLAMAGLVPVARRLTTRRLRGPLLLGIVCAAFFVIDEVGRRLYPWLGEARFGATWLAYKGYFLLGTAALITRRTRMPLFALIAVALLMFGWDHALEHAYRYHRWANVSPFYEWLGITSMAALVLLSPTEWRWTKGRVGRVVLDLGTFSYSLYVTHLLVVGRLTARLVAAGRMPKSVWGNWVVVALELALCLGVAKVFYDRIERPAWRWSKRIGQSPVRAEQSVLAIDDRDGARQ